MDVSPRASRGKKGALQLFSFVNETALEMCSSHSSSDYRERVHPAVQIPRQGWLLRLPSNQVENLQEPVDQGVGMPLRHKYFAQVCCRRLSRVVSYFLVRLSSSNSKVVRVKQA